MQILIKYLPGVAIVLGVLSDWKQQLLLKEMQYWAEAGSEWQPSAFSSGQGCPDGMKALKYLTCPSDIAP